MSAADVTRERILDFPGEAGLGAVWIPVDLHSGAWRKFAAAQGRLVIHPPNVRVRLELTGDRSLAHLVTWDAHGVQEMTLQGASDGKVALLSHLIGLHVLIVRRTALSQGTLASLSALPQLTSLELNGCELDDDGLAQMGACRLLRSLSISDAVLDGRGLHALHPLTSLERLALRRVPLTEVAGLRGLPSLRELDCSDTPLRDEHLDDIASLSHLEVLRLANVDVSTQALLELKQRLPGLRLLHTRAASDKKGAPRHHSRVDRVPEAAPPFRWSSWRDLLPAAGPDSLPAPTVPAAAVAPDLVSNMEAARQLLPGDAVDTLQQGQCTRWGVPGPAHLATFYENQSRQGLPVLLTSDILVGTVPRLCRNLRSHLAGPLFEDLLALVLALYEGVQTEAPDEAEGRVRAMLRVALAILEEDRLAPRVDSLLERLSEFKSDGRNWPAQEHASEWWQLLHAEGEVFDELHLRRTWPAARDGVLGALRGYLQQERPVRPLDGLAGAELDRLRTAVPALCALTGRRLAYEALVSNETGSDRLRKVDETVRWLQAVEWPWDSAEAALLRRALNTGSSAAGLPLNDLWERLFMVETLLSDTCGPTLASDTDCGTVGLFGRRTNPWWGFNGQLDAVRDQTEAGNFPQSWGWVLAGLLEDAEAPDAPAFLRTPVWHEKLVSTVVAGVLLAGGTPRRLVEATAPPGTRHLEAGVDRRSGNQPILEAWVEPVPRFMHRLHCWLSLVQIALNALHLASFDLSLRLQRILDVTRLLQEAIVRQARGQYHPVDACRRLSHVAQELGTASMLQAGATEGCEVALSAPADPQRRLGVGIWQRWVAPCPRPDGTFLIAAGAALPVYGLEPRWTPDTWAYTQAVEPQDETLTAWRPVHG